MDRRFHYPLRVRIALLTIVSALVTQIVVEIITLSKSLSNNIDWWRDQFRIPDEQAGDSRT